MKFFSSLFLLLAAVVGFSAAATTVKGYCNKSSTADVKGYKIPIPTLNNDYRCLLKEKKSKGTPVKTLQTVLNSCYSRSLKVDGIFGPKTKTALKYAQGKAGTTKDGVYGPNTANKIKWRGTKSGKSVCKTAKQWNAL